MWGSCFWFCNPGLLRLLLPSPASRLPSHILQHTNLTHTNLTHTNLTYNNFTHTNLTHTNLTYNNFTHTNLTYNRFTHTNLTHTNVTYNNFTHTNLTRNNFTHTNFGRGVGVAIGDIHRDIMWQAWHNLTSTVVLRGRRGVSGTGRRPWTGICRLWRPGRRATLRGRRGIWWHPPWYRVACVAQTHIYRRFAWQAWRFWYWVAPLDWDLSPVTSGAPRHFAWQAWYLVTSTLISRGRATLRGRRDTW